MKGHKAQVRPGVWKLRVYRGVDPRTGKKAQKTETFEGTEAEAARRLANLVLEVRAGRHPFKAGSVADVLHRWLQVADLAPATRDDYQRVIDQWINPNIGRTSLARLRVSDLDLFYRRMNETVGPARVRRAHNILSAAFGQAVRWRELDANIARDARPPKVARNDIDPPDVDAVLRVLHEARHGTERRRGRDVARSLDLYAYLFLVTNTGCRRSEALGCRWCDIDIDLNEGAVRFRHSIVASGGKKLLEPTKTRRARPVSLDAQTVSILRDHRAQSMRRAMEFGVGWSDEVFVFHPTGLYKGQPEPAVPLQPSQLGHTLQLIRGKVDAPKVTIRQLRHFVATQMLAAGDDIVTVSARLGHARTSTTLDVYAHHLPAKDREAANTIARLLGRDSGT